MALLLSIPLTISLISQQEKTQSQAAGGSTVLSFSPDSSTTTPIQASVGSPFDLDLYVTPGSDQVTFIKYQITFDPAKIQLDTSNPVTLNTTKQSVTDKVVSNVEGPVLNNSSGTLAQAVSVGSNPGDAITTKTKVATVHFKAVGGTNGGTTTITFNTTVSQVLSSSSNEQASQNVLASTMPAVISISGNGTPNLSPIPTITGTALQFTLLLDGVGSAGDNPNPTGNSLSNKNPQHPQRNVDIQVFNTNNQAVASSSAALTYDSSTGTFVGAIGLPSTVPSGEYSIKVQTDRYLRKLIPSIQQIIANQATTVPEVRLIAGDTNNDNTLSALDYNALLDCGYGELNPLPMNDPNSTFHSQNCQAHDQANAPVEDVDLNDDGIINSTDFNLFLRELSVQSGD